MNVLSTDDLKAHLIATDETFAKLATEHSTYKQKVAELEAKAELSHEEEQEEHRLKKLKLKLKDEMAEIMNRYQAQHAH